MATQLKNIVEFTNVAAGAFAVLPHGLRNQGFALVPDEVKLSNGEFVYIAADDTNLTVRNLGAIEQNCDALVEHWHTLERAFGPRAVVALSPQPFVGAASSGGGGGGNNHYVPPEQWTQQNVAAGQTDVELAAQVSTGFNRVVMPRPGSITGLVTRLTEAIIDATPGSLIVVVTINGVAGALSLSHSSGANPSGGRATQASAIDVYAAGDELGTQLTTLGSFAPVTTDLEAWIDVEV